MSTRRTQEKFTTALVLSVEAWTVTVSRGTQMLAMLKAVLLAASMSGSDVE